MYLWRKSLSSSTNCLIGAGISWATSAQAGHNVCVARASHLAINSRLARVVCSLCSGALNLSSLDELISGRRVISGTPAPAPQKTHTPPPLRLILPVNMTLNWCYCCTGARLSPSSRSSSRFLCLGADSRGPLNVTQKNG